MFLIILPELKIRVTGRITIKQFYPFYYSSSGKRMNKSRFNFVDLMRGLAMIVMIEVHVVNSLMQPNLRTETWFIFINFINGMVAPSFIFISGFAFMLASQSKLSEFRSLKYAFWKQLGRIILIWILGYLLHIPFFSFDKCKNVATTEQWMKFFSIDVLQCIAFGLLLIFILRLLIKSDKIFIWIILFLGLFTVVPAEKIYTISFEKTLPVFIAMYITPIYNTNFPLFPWFGFMAAGTLAARFFLKSREKGSEPFFMKNLLISGIFLSIIAIPPIFFIEIKDIRPNILFFTARLGVVFIILTGSYYYCERKQKITPIILYPSRESLAVYFMHLQVIYRKFWFGESIFTLYKSNLNFETCLIISSGIAILMLPMAWTWNYYKTKYNYFGRIAVVAMFITGGFVFLMK